MAYCKPSENHDKHIAGGYFQKNCDKCALFIGNYLMHGRRFKFDNAEDLAAIEQTPKGSD
jgi:hypothetical protein